MPPVLMPSSASPKQVLLPPPAPSILGFVRTTSYLISGRSQRAFAPWVHSSIQRACQRRCSPGARPFSGACSTRHLPSITTPSDGIEGGKCGRSERSNATRARQKPGFGFTWGRFVRATRSASHSDRPSLCISHASSIAPLRLTPYSQWISAAGGRLSPGSVDAPRPRAVPDKFTVARPGVAISLPLERGEPLKEPHVCRNWIAPRRNGEMSVSGWSTIKQR